MNIGNIPPSILRSINAQPMQWKVALGEACDNSFDSGANWVRIVFHGDKQVEITDDGGGCNNIEAMLTIGSHYKQANTKLGRFGVGLKELACWLWGELVIQTIHGGVVRKAAIDWERLAKAPDWNVPDPTEMPVEHQQRGTKLLFRKTIRNRPGDLALLADELGYLFAPALWNGKQIAIESGKKKLTVAAWQLPEFEGDVVRDSFSVNGKRVDMTAGVVASDHVNSRKGFTFIHEFRVLLNSALGSGGKSVSRICGTVVLGPEWKLGKNKDAIQDSDDQMKALEQAIYARCESILDRGERQSTMLRNTAFEGAVTTALRGLLSAAVDDNQADSKAKRATAKNETGRVKPSETGRRHKRARNQQSGQTFKGKTSLAAIRFEWESRQDGMIGRADIPGNVVYLNDNHRRLIHHRDRENVDAIADLCCVILSEEVIRNRESSKLPIVRDFTDITSAISEVLRRQQEADDEVACGR